MPWNQWQLSSGMGGRLALESVAGLVWNTQDPNRLEDALLLVMKIEPVPIIPKYRRKNVFGQIRKELGGVFHRLAKQKESLIEEGHIMADHVYMMISIPPKYAVSQVTAVPQSFYGLEPID